MTSRLYRAATVAVVAVLAGGISPALAATTAATTSRVSVSGSEAQADNASNDAVISANGRFAAFSSSATDLVPGDTNGARDVFVRDLIGGTTSRVSVSSGGVQPNGDFSILPAISADGRYVAFNSDASNLVSGDTNATNDVFLRDRQAGTTRRVSVSTAGGQGNAYSGLRLALSADGSHVAYTSEASNLVPGDTNNWGDLFVRDVSAATTSRVNVSGTGAQDTALHTTDAPSISAGGRYVTFSSSGSTLVPGDVNGKADVFIRDRIAGTTALVSVSTAGTQGDRASGGASISAGGRFIVFTSPASNLVPDDTNPRADVFLRDRATGTTTRVSVSDASAQANGDSYLPSISADGRYVAFTSVASNLVRGDTNHFVDVFVRDRRSSSTSRLSVSSSGAQGNGNSTETAGSISADGRYVVFGSQAANLVPGDTNATDDVFLRDRGASAGSG